MSTVHRVIKNTGFLYAKMGITMFISLYSTRLILSTLGDSDFGIFNLVGGAIAMLGFLNGAMAGATQRFMSFAEGEGNIENKKKIFNISFVLHFIISILMLLVLLIAGYYFFSTILKINPERVFAAKVVYGSFIISSAFTIMTVPYDAVLNSHENMLYFSIVGVLESILKLAAALLITFNSGDKLILYGIVMACIPLITLSVMRIYCHRIYIECEIAPRKYWDKKLEREMVSFAGWNLLGLASGMISQYGLSIVLNNFFGVILNAAQGIANQISGQLMVFSNTMMKALNPVIAKSEGIGNRNLMLSASLSGSKYGFILLALFAIPFIIETTYILNIWLKKVPEWAILFTRLQLLRSLIEQFTVMLVSTLSAQGDIKVFTILRSIVNISPIILTFILFNMGFPPYYLYITWIFAGGILSGWILLHYSQKKCGLSLNDYFKIVFIPNFILSVLMFSISFIPVLYMDSSFKRLILVSSISTLVLIASFLTYYTTKSEKQLFKVLISKLYNRVRFI